MARGNTYVTLNRRTSNNPLRSVPLLRHPSAVFGTAWHDGTWNRPKAEPVAAVASRTRAALVRFSVEELRLTRRKQACSCTCADS